MRKKNDGLIAGYVFDQKGGARQVTLDEAEAMSPEESLIWLHFDYTNKHAVKWLHRKCGLDAVVSTALTAEESRPRTFSKKEGTFLSLRGVNLNPGSDPEDMVSIRMWLEKNRIITARRRFLLSVQDIRTSLEQGDGPTSTAAFLIKISHLLSYRINDVVDDIDEQTTDLEEAVLVEPGHEVRMRIANIRRQIVSMRRYIAPQRDVFSRLYLDKIDWLDDADHMRLREYSDISLRLVEDLDAARDRASVAHEELVSKISEQINTRMYVLAIVAAIFLPLTFVTGLLGINVSGIPYATSAWAFSVVTFVLVLAAVVEGIYLKFKKWL